MNKRLAGVVKFKKLGSHVLHKKVRQLRVFHCSRAKLCCFLYNFFRKNSESLAKPIASFLV